MAVKEKKLKTYRDIILEVDGDLSRFEKSSFATYEGYCRYRGILRYGSD